MPLKAQQPWSHLFLVIMLTCQSECDNDSLILTYCQSSLPVWLGSQLLILPNQQSPFSVYRLALCVDGYFLAEFCVVSSSLTPAVGPVETFCQLKLGREELTDEIETGCSSSILSQFISPQHPLLSLSLCLHLSFFSLFISSSSPVIYYMTQKEKEAFIF